MSQLHFYVPDAVELRLRESAKRAAKPLSRYLGELVKEKTHPVEQWPDDYFEQVFGGWEGRCLERDAQGEFERRSELR